MAEGVFAMKGEDNDDEFEEFDRLALDFILVKHKAPI